MTQNFSIVIDVALVVFVVREVWRFVGRYRRLKQDVERGDVEARSRLYRRALVFQWGSAALALLALRFDWDALRPGALSLEQSPLVQSLMRSGDSTRGGMMGIVLGLILGTIGFVVAGRRARRRGAAMAATARWRKFLPDFTPLLPVTARERLLWLAVAISAGVCEEIVFRGWLLSVLHGPVGLAGTALIVCAAAAFGLAHAYQGPAGVVLATAGGVLFCVLYVTTGSLLIPILLHVAVDARFALLPGPRGAPDAGTAIPLPGSLRAAL
jgi:uncharacterized protein